MPVQVWPPWNRTLSPGFRLVALTFATVFHGRPLLVPLLLSEPDGLT